jgi:hypothetical protein
VAVARFRKRRLHCRPARLGHAGEEDLRQAID